MVTLGALGHRMDILKAPQATTNPSVTTEPRALRRNKGPGANAISFATQIRDLESSAGSRRPTAWELELSGRSFRYCYGVDNGFRLGLPRQE